jgi:hypothetical protein
MTLTSEKIKLMQIDWEMIGDYKLEREDDNHISPLPIPLSNRHCCRAWSRCATNKSAPPGRDSNFSRMRSQVASLSTYHHWRLRLNRLRRGTNHVNHNVWVGEHRDVTAVYRVRGGAHPEHLELLNEDGYVVGSSKPSPNRASSAVRK